MILACCRSTSGWPLRATALWRWLGCAVLMWVCGLALLAPSLANARAMVPALQPQPTHAGYILPPVSLPIDQVTLLDQACMLPDTYGGNAPPDASKPWLHLKLPHQWHRTHPDHHGAIWYRFRVVLPEQPKRTWAVYLPRVIMNGQVWINDVALGYSGSMSEPVTRNWYVPLMFTVPTNLWHPGENTVFVRVAGGYMSNDGLAPINIGPVEQVAHAYQLRRWMQVDGPQIIHVGLIVIGLMMITIWLRDRDQSAFGYMGMSAIFWGASTLMMISPNVPTSPEVWEVLCDTLTAWFQLSLTAFYFRFGDVRWPWLYRLMAAHACFLALFYALVPLLWGPGIIASFNYLLAIVAMVCAVWHVVRHKRPDGWWVVLGCAIILPAGWHDVQIALGYMPYGSTYFLALFGPVTIVFSFVVLAGDYARSRSALHELNRSLAFRVAERESALRESFERLNELERTQAVSAERSRILKDMHDGVGAHLTSALRQLQSPREAGVDLGLVTQTLRDSLDQLKLSVDALSLMPGDVLGLLASLRFRISPRLKAAGLELLWDVDELPNWPSGQAPALRQLQYILFEGLSNVLQHSGANRLTLLARAFEDHIQVSLIDNGRGWGADEVGAVGEGQGLQAMRARASVIGATVEFRAAPEGGAELRVMLPLRQQRWSDLSSAA
jgi:signal transduction histidine kinase